MEFYGLKQRRSKKILKNVSWKVFYCPSTVLPVSCVVSHRYLSMWKRISPLFPGNAQVALSFLPVLGEARILKLREKLRGRCSSVF